MCMDTSKKRMTYVDALVVYDAIMWISNIGELTWQEYDSRSPVIRIKEQIFRLLSPLL